MAYLTLEDGTVYEGASFGAKIDTIGEVVFNTGMTGYQEVLTDPSYCGQIVTMTYPLIGNYGVNAEDSESDKPQVRAIVVREMCEKPSNWRSEGSLDEYLKKNNIPGIQGVDTRALTRKIRDFGTMRAILTQEMPSSKAIDEIKNYSFTNPVDIVTCKQKYVIGEGDIKIALIDFGVKHSIIKNLLKRNIQVFVYPAKTPANEILAGNFDGVMLTNGPGNPKENSEAIENIKQLYGKIPIFGICLGHQLLALAKGGDTQKLKYGHRGSNHPVKDLKKDRVFITSQNHGYAVIESKLPENAKVSHKNLNDGTVEGIEYLDAPAFTVQFHPEASPGPEETAYLFNRFIDMINKNKRG